MLLLELFAARMSIVAEIKHSHPAHYRYCIMKQCIINVAPPKKNWQSASLHDQRGDRCRGHKSRPFLYHFAPMRNFRFLGQVFAQTPERLTTVCTGPLNCFQFVPSSLSVSAVALI